MKLILSIAVAILTFATVYIATIVNLRWYKITISFFFTAIVTILVYANYSWL